MLFDLIKFIFSFNPFWRIGQNLWQLVFEWIKAKKKGFWDFLTFTSAVDASDKTEKTKLFKKKVAKTRSLYDLFQDLQSSDGTIDIANLEKEVANEFDVST